MIALDHAVGVGLSGGLEDLDRSLRALDVARSDGGLVLALAQHKIYIIVLQVVIIFYLTTQELQQKL